MECKEEEEGKRRQPRPTNLSRVPQQREFPTCQMDGEKRGLERRDSAVPASDEQTAIETEIGLSPANTHGNTSHNAPPSSLLSLEELRNRARMSVNRVCVPVLTWSRS